MRFACWCQPLGPLVHRTGSRFVPRSCKIRQQERCVSFQCSKDALFVQCAKGVCGVLCVLLCCVFHVVLSVVGAGQFSQMWEKARGKWSDWAGRGLPCLGAPCTARSASGCFEGHDKFQLATPLSHKRVGTAGRLRNRCLPRQLLEKAQSCAGALSSTLRACAWPLYLRGLSCSAFLKAPSVPPRACAVAQSPSTVRTSIVQRWRPPGLDTTTSMRASFTVPS